MDPAEALTALALALCVDGAPSAAAELPADASILVEDIQVLRKEAFGTAWPRIAATWRDGRARCHIATPTSAPEIFACEVLDLVREGQVWRRRLAFAGPITGSQWGLCWPEKAP